MHVEVIGLTVELGGRRILDGLDLTVAEGERVAVIGGNGTGKTTLLRCLAGWCRASGGTVRVGGVPATGTGSGHDLGVVLGDLPARPGHRVGDHLRRLAALSGARPADLEDVARSFAVDTFAHRRVRSLSTGMRRRAQLAGAFAARPRTLLLDEPTNGLDAAGIEPLRQELVRVGRDRRSAIVVTHDLAFVADVVDRIEEVRAGRLVGHERSR